MKRLILIGAGGFGRELCAWARQCHEYRKDWEIAGFLDDNPDALARFQHPLSILGPIASYEPMPGDCFVSAIGQPRLRRKLMAPLLEKGAVFTNLIHPSVIIGERVSLGSGVVICPGSVLSCDISIGDITALNLQVSVGHDAVVGSYCQISSFCDITGGVTMEDEVFLGSHATILPWARVGTRAVVGANSTVLHEAPANTTVAGNPSRVLHEG